MPFWIKLAGHRSSLVDFFFLYPPQFTQDCSHRELTSNRPAMWKLYLLSCLACWPGIAIQQVVPSHAHRVNSERAREQESSGPSNGHL